MKLLGWHVTLFFSSQVNEKIKHATETWGCKKDKIISYAYSLIEEEEIKEMKKSTNLYVRSMLIPHDVSPLMVNPSVSNPLYGVLILP